MKDYTILPISAVKLFKPKDLYILAGMYLSAFSSRSSGDTISTNITQKQLAELTGVDEEYIRKRFMPRLKESGFCNVECRQTDYTTKRNTYLLIPGDSLSDFLWYLSSMICSKSFCC